MHRPQNGEYTGGEDVGSEVDRLSGLLELLLIQVRFAKYISLNGKYNNLTLQTYKFKIVKYIFKNTWFRRLQSQSVCSSWNKDWPS